MTMQGKNAVLLIAAAIGAHLLPAAVQAQDAGEQGTASGFQMAAVVDRARGKAVVAGDYAQAIEALGSKRGRHFESSTNLCVAYTMTGDLAKAGIECAAALTLSERSAVRRDIAVALSNRGVVKAVSGDFSGARDDFRQAIELNADLAYASANLQRLGTAKASDA